MPTEEAVSTGDSAASAAAVATESPAPTATAQATPTPEAVALVAPVPITNSEVVENVQREDVVGVTSYGFNVPVLWVAQGSALLLTVLLASLWWRSRTRTR
jgi:hypothetical protein